MGVSSKQGRWILLATILASGMSFLGGTAVSIALPTIQSFFDASISSIQWVFSAHALTLAALILISGSLGDHFGRKKIFSYGIILFTLGALLSGLATSINQLIFLQAFQGIGSAMMIPGSLAIINYCFEESKRGKAIGLWAGYSGGLAALGPFIGGLLVENLGWQSVFFINVPIGLLVLFITIKHVPESKNPESQKIDYLGAALIILGLFGISYGLIKVPSVGWNDVGVLRNIILGIIALIAFIIVEAKTKNPLLPLKIFKNPLVTGANIATLSLYFALNGTIFFLVLNFQQIQGYSPSFAGLGLLPPIILITFLSGPAGSIADKIGPRLQMIAGPLIVALGMALLIIPGVGQNYFVYFMPGLILFGLGMAIVIAPLTKSALSVDKKFSGVASGVNNSVSRIAALMAVAILGALLITLFTISLESSINNSELNEQNKIEILEQRDKLANIKIPDNFSENDAKSSEKIIKNSFVRGFRYSMGVNALLALFSAVTSFFLIHNKKIKKRIVK